MAYPGYGGGFGSFGGQIPGMQMQMGQSVPGIGPNMLPGGYPAYPPCSDTYSSPDASMWTYFTAVAGQPGFTVTTQAEPEPFQDGEVDAEELQRCLTQSGISGTYAPTPPQEYFPLSITVLVSLQFGNLQNHDCHVGYFTGKMGFNEFKELWAALNAWKQNFMAIDQDCSGTVEHHELSQAIAIMGYRLSPQTLAAIVKRYSKNGRIFFDDYVACCVKLRALTDFFRRRDHLQQGFVNFIYEDGTMTI